MDCSLQGSSMHGIFQARMLEWVAISFSKGSSQPWDPTPVSRISVRRFTIWATKEAHGSRSVVSDSLRPHGLWNSPGQNTGVGNLFLLQGIFLTQGLNPGLPHCTWILYQLSHEGNPRILEQVACPFSSESSQPRGWTRVFCIAGGFFTNWAIREAHIKQKLASFFSIEG